MENPDTEYVNNDAIIEENKPVEVPEGKVLFNGRVDGVELTAEREALIIALPETKATKTVPLSEDTGDLVIVAQNENAKVVETGETCRMRPRTVRKILRCSLRRAHAVLKQLNAEGKIKTKEERYKELYPPEVVEEPAAAPIAEPAPEPEPVESQTIDDIGLSGAVVTAINSVGIFTVDELCSKTEAEILDVPGIGPAYLENIKDALASLGLSLKT